MAAGAKRRPPRIVEASDDEVTPPAKRAAVGRREAAPSPASEAPTVATPPSLGWSKTSLSSRSPSASADGDGDGPLALSPPPPDTRRDKAQGAAIDRPVPGVLVALAPPAVPPPAPAVDLARTHTLSVVRNGLRHELTIPAQLLEPLMQLPAPQEGLQVSYPARINAVEGLFSLAALRALVFGA